MTAAYQIPIRALVRTTTSRFGRKTVIGHVIARRRVLGREQYLVEWSVIVTWNEPGDLGEYSIAKWRPLSRIFGQDVSQVPA